MVSRVERSVGLGSKFMFVLSLRGSRNINSTIGKKKSTSTVFAFCHTIVGEIFVLRNIRV